MSKSVLISVQPKFSRLIASGKKTVEVRKSKPKLETPFKCYIYETKGLYKGAGGYLFRGSGKVIGEFICDYITSFKAMGEMQALWNETQNTCLTRYEIIKYAKGKRLYYWHISDLVIYDKRKELSRFYTDCKMNCEYCEMWGSVRVNAEEFDMDCKSDWFNHKPLKRPPQSWGYVEEVNYED